uniref:Microtubule-associated serine/threonine-protein kinase 4 n=1 Tax=Lygus hesperus TaxID=30085 RepID=A0A0A9X4J9_LYGHE
MGGIGKYSGNRDKGAGEAGGIDETASRDNDTRRQQELRVCAQKTLIERVQEYLERVGNGVEGAVYAVRKCQQMQEMAIWKRRIIDAFVEVCDTTHENPVLPTLLLALGSMFEHSQQADTTLDYPLYRYCVECGVVDRLKGLSSMHVDYQLSVTQLVILSRILLLQYFGEFVAVGEDDALDTQRLNTALFQRGIVNDNLNEQYIETMNTISGYHHPILDVIYFYQEVERLYKLNEPIPSSILQKLDQVVDGIKRPVQSKTLELLERTRIF